jgi:hypothetical protein
MAQQIGLRLMGWTGCIPREDSLARITWSIGRNEKPFDASRLEVTAI